MKELEVTLQTLQSERQQLAEDDQEMIRQRAKLEFDVKDLEESLMDDKKSKVNNSTSARQSALHSPFSQYTCSAVKWSFSTYST